MPSPIEVARRRAAELEAELKQIQSFIEMYQMFSTEDETERQSATTSASNAVSSEVVHRNDSPAVPTPQVVATRRKRRSGPAPKEIVELVARMIREAGRPLTRGDITDMLDARDVELPGADKARYVGTIMWRNKAQFLNIEGRGYWLRGEPIPVPVRLSLDNIL